MIFPDFSSLCKIPWLFPDWKMPSHFSRFSGPSGNPDRNHTTVTITAFWGKLNAKATTKTQTHRMIKGARGLQSDIWRKGTPAVHNEGIHTDVDTDTKPKTNIGINSHWLKWRNNTSQMYTWWRLINVPVQLGACLWNNDTTGRERLIRSHSSARFCFELSGNSN